MGLSYEGFVPLPGSRHPPDPTSVPMFPPGASLSSPLCGIDESAPLSPHREEGEQPERAEENKSSLCGEKCLKGTDRPLAERCRHQALTNVLFTGQRVKSIGLSGRDSKLIRAQRQKS